VIDVVVLMPVYNGERGLGVTSILEDAIESILCQECDLDFKLVIINDGSTDRTESILENYSADQRVETLHFHDNFGCAHALNEGLGLALTWKPKYFCIQGSDDFSTTARLQAQYDFLERHPIVQMAGCWFDKISWDGTQNSGVNVLPHRNDDLFIKMVNGTVCLGYPMWRAAVHQAVGYYDETQFPTHGSDYDFMLRVAEYGQLGMVQECLYVARQPAPEYQACLSADKDSHAAAWYRAKKLSEFRRQAKCRVKQ
jgi:glycosyltransferase involved in cell wall biosynthesis